MKAVGHPQGRGWVVATSRGKVAPAVRGKEEKRTGE